MYIVVFLHICLCDGVGFPGPEVTDNLWVLVIEPGTSARVVVSTINH